MLYLVFAGDNYYPGGGWEDFQSAHTTPEEADAAVEELRKINDWAQVVDLLAALT